MSAFPNEQYMNTASSSLFFTYPIIVPYFRMKFENF